MVGKEPKKLFNHLGINGDHYCGIIVAHGDKCYGYKSNWQEADIPFEHGVALYLLTYVSPFDKESRETKNGWINPSDRVIANYPKYKDILTTLEK